MFLFAKVMQKVCIAKEYDENMPYLFVKMTKTIRRVKIPITVGCVLLRQTKENWQNIKMQPPARIRNNLRAAFFSVSASSENVPASFGKRTYVFRKTYLRFFPLLPYSLIR